MILQSQKISKYRIKIQNYKSEFSVESNIFFRKMTIIIEDSITI